MKRLFGRRGRRPTSVNDVTPERAGAEVVALQRQIGKRGRNPLMVWLLRGGAMTFLVVAAVFAFASFVLGIPRAAELLMGVASPHRDAASVLDLMAGWSVTFTGWLVAPALVGAVVAYLVNSSLNAIRNRTLGDIEGPHGVDSEE